MRLGNGSEEMIVRVRLFAILRERAGRDALELRLRSGATVADAMRALSETPPLGDALPEALRRHDVMALPHLAEGRLDRTRIAGRIAEGGVCNACSQGRTKVGEG